jgi:hypothetical protein
MTRVPASDVAGFGIVLTRTCGILLVLAGLIHAGTAAGQLAQPPAGPAPAIETKPLLLHGKTNAPASIETKGLLLFGRAGQHAVIETKPLLLFGKTGAPAVVETRSLLLVGKVEAPAAIETRELLLFGRTAKTIETRGLFLIGKAADPPEPRGPGRVVAEPPDSGPGPRVSCAGGVVRDGECLCPRTHRAVQAGREAWRCIRIVVVDPPRPSVVTPQPKISCAGGTVRNGKCDCERGFNAIAAGNNAFRCVRVVTLPEIKLPSSSAVACRGGVVRAGTCYCAKGKSLKNGACVASSTPPRVP